ncbi:MAG TPA: hypothetical protein VM537_34615 [Anaerolineae bacterium]|nr:hypothetical protein [Anaerolineae bacterium]
MPQAPTAAPPPEVQYTRGQSDAAAASGGGGAGIGDLLRKLTGSDETPDYGLASPEGGGVSGIDAEAYLQDFAQGEGRDILDETADKGARPGFFGKMSNLMNGDEWGATRGETGRGNFMDEIQGDKWGTLLRASLGTMEAAGQPGATGLGSIGTGGLKGMDFLEAKKNKEYERDYADKLFGYKQGRDTKADVFKERELTAAEASAASLAGQRDSQSGYYAKLGDNLSVEASDARDRTRILADRASTERYNAENLRSDRDADNIRQRDANATDAFVTLSTSYAESSNILPDEDGYEDVMRENNYRAIETIAGTPIAEGTSIQIDYLKAAEMANGIADGSLSITDLPEDVDPKLIAYILKRQNR